MPSSLYRTVLSTTQHKMTTAIDEIRNSIPHVGETGSLIERVFRSQLQDLLPKKVAVSNGFVIDSKGNVSRQMDIILYDRLNTPRIFASEGAQMFPVETTYACGEIKTEMDSTKFIDSFKKCLSYKRLSRSAHLPRVSLIPSYTLFGSQWDHWQSIFFCISAHSISASTLMSEYKRFVKQEALEVHERIDTFVSLDANNNENMLLNGLFEINGGTLQSIDLLPCPNSKICTYPAKEPWSLFVMLLLRYMTQAPTSPINILAYGGEEPY